MNWVGLPIYVALESVDMRTGYERLGGMVRDRMKMEPRARALCIRGQARPHDEDLDVGWQRRRGHKQEAGLRPL